MAKRPRLSSPPMVQPAKPVKAAKAAKATHAEGEFFRRPPVQARSRELVARILGATRRLLERDGLQRLTTNHIAREAGVDVASLYQYFASKEAILYTLAEQWTEQVQAVYRHHLAQLDTAPALLQSLRTMFDELQGLPDTDWNWRHLAPAMSIVPVLRDLESEHEDRTTQFWMAWLRHHGVAWDETRLEALARMFYVQIDSALTLAGRLPPDQGRWIRHWQRRQSLALLRVCFPKRRSRR